MGSESQSDSPVGLGAPLFCRRDSGGSREAATVGVEDPKALA